MNNLSKKDKEQLIIGTIINCNTVIKSFDKKLFESNNFDLYQSNMLNLYSAIIEKPVTSLLNESVLKESLKILTPELQLNQRKNYYAYFQQVQKFLDIYEPNIQQSLNESFDTKNVTNPLILNITTFNNELKNIIQKLEKQNDFENYTDNILKIKTSLNQPLNVCGYNISNNLALQSELNMFSVFQELKSIYFNKNNKQLYFVVNSTIAPSTLIVYDISTDLLDTYKNTNNETFESFDFSMNCLEDLKASLGVNVIYEIYKDFKTLKLEFKDNLYKDNLRWQYKQQLEKNNSIVK